MRFARAAGIMWALIYFAVGVVFSFTLGNNDFWSGVAVYLTLFLLPLPATIMAVWLPRVAAGTLIACVVVSVCVSVVSAVRSGVVPDLHGLCKFVLLHVPHLIFAACYMMSPQSGDDAYAQMRH